MYYSIWKGKYYEAGFKYGERLYKNGINLRLDMQLNRDKIRYGEKVRPLYEEVYPKIIDEIEGFSDGIKEDFYANMTENKALIQYGLQFMILVIGRYILAKEIHQEKSG